MTGTLLLLWSVCRDTVDLSQRTYTAPHFHSTPTHPLLNPPDFSLPSRQPVLHSPSPSHPLSSHHPKATSATAHSWTFQAARDGSRTQVYSQEKPVPLQHSLQEHRSQHQAPSDHHSLQHHPLTAKSWSSRGVQTSSKADPSSVVSRYWLENLKLDQKVSSCCPSSPCPGEVLSDSKICLKSLLM